MLRSDSPTGFDPAQWTMTDEHRRPLRLQWVDHKIKLVVAVRGVVVNFRRGGGHVLLRRVTGSTSMAHWPLELCGRAALWYNTANRENWDEEQT